MHRDRQQAVVQVVKTSLRWGRDERGIHVDKIHTRVEIIRVYEL